MKRPPKLEKSFSELLQVEKGPKAPLPTLDKHQPAKSRMRKQSNTQAESNYRVVLCLPAPALCKVLASRLLMLECDAISDKKIAGFM